MKDRNGKPLEIGDKVKIVSWENEDPGFKDYIGHACVLHSVGGSCVGLKFDNPLNGCFGWRLVWARNLEKVEEEPKGVGKAKPIAPKDLYCHFAAGDPIWFEFCEAFGEGEERGRTYQGVVYDTVFEDSTHTLQVCCEELHRGNPWWYSVNRVHYYAEDPRQAGAAAAQRLGWLPAPKSGVQSLQEALAAIKIAQYIPADRYTYVELELQDGRVMRTPEPEGEGWEEVRRSEYPHGASVIGGVTLEELQCTDYSGTHTVRWHVAGVHPAFLADLQPMYAAGAPVMFVRKLVKYERTTKGLRSPIETPYEYPCPSKQPLQGKWPESGGRISGPLTCSK